MGDGLLSFGVSVSPCLILFPFRILHLLTALSFQIHDIFKSRTVFSQWSEMWLNNLLFSWSTSCRPLKFGPVLNHGPGINTSSNNRGDKIIENFRLRRYFKFFKGNTITYMIARGKSPQKLVAIGNGRFLRFTSCSKPIRSCSKGLILKVVLSIWRLNSSKA